jgi:RNA polymerase sigma-70 factor (ECF subfamily)
MYPKGQMAASAQSEQIDCEGRLVRRACRGEVEAFERLYREHIGAVYGLCLRLTRERTAAEDCAQEAFVNAWRTLEHFESRSRFRTWLHRIAVNVVLSRRRRAVTEVEWAPLPEGSAEDLDSAAQTWTLDTPLEVRELETAIDTLPEGARDALVLCAIYGYSHGEAARMLGVAAGTCKAQLHRARTLLRARLETETQP